jgi:hypothetical protein
MHGSTVGNTTDTAVMILCSPWVTREGTASSQRQEDSLAYLLDSDMFEEINRKKIIVMRYQN